MTTTYNNFPTGLALQKPQQEAPTGNLAGLIVLQKYDGHRIHLMIDSTGNPRLFSHLGSVELTSKLPGLIARARNLHLPANSLFDGELFSAKRESAEATTDIVGAGNDPLCAQRERDLEARIALFDLITLGGEDWSQKPYRSRFQAITCTTEHVFRARQWNLKSNVEAIAKAKELKVKGFVAYHPNAAHNVNLNGNSKRGQCWKIKPNPTDDLVCTSFNHKDGRIASINVAQVGPDGLEPLGKIGSFSKGFQPEAHELPFMIEVKHQGTDERGNLKFPSVVRARPDLKVPPTIR